MLAAAMSWAAGPVASKRVRWTTPTAALTGWLMVVGGVPVALGALWLDGGFDPAGVSWAAWLCAFYAACLPMLFCQWAWFKVVEIFPAAVAAIGTLAIPVLGVISSNLALGEPIGPEVLGSLALVVVALGLVLMVPALRRRLAIDPG